MEQERDEALRKNKFLEERLSQLEKEKEEIEGERDMLERERDSWLKDSPKECKLKKIVCMCVWCSHMLACVCILYYLFCLIWGEI